MGESTAQWLDADAAAAHLSIRVDKLYRLVRDGKLPKPTERLGRNTKRWNREDLDKAMGGETVSTDRRPTIEESIARLAANPPASRWSKARRQAKAGRQHG